MFVTSLSLSLSLSTFLPLTRAQWLKDLKAANVTQENPCVYRSPTTGEVLFRAPVGRTLDAFLKESKNHGWPSFRDEEAIGFEGSMRCLRDGEVVTTDGVHLGHNSAWDVVDGWGVWLG